MKIMEADKQEKYILLNTDSDLEECEKSKTSLVHHPQEGKPYSRSQSAKKFSPCCQSQWSCHAIFLLLILSSQIFLSLIVLKLHKKLEALKQEEASVQKNGSFDIAKEQKNVETNYSRQDQMDSKLKLLNQQEVTYDLENIYKLNLSTVLEFHEVKEKIIHLQNNMLNLTDQFLSMETVIDSLLHSVNPPHPVDEKLNILEKQLENTTMALTNLQKHLEEGLDTAFLQILQLKDGFYFPEDSKNHNSVDHASPYPSPLKPSQETKLKLSTPWQPFVTSSTDNEVSVPESTTQISEDTRDSVTVKGKSKLNISFIKTLTDLQVFYYGADTNANGYLTYSEIESLLGEDAPREEQLKPFDEDNNNMYSYLEMIRAFELTEVKPEFKEVTVHLETCDIIVLLTIIMQIGFLLSYARKIVDLS